MADWDDTTNVAGVAQIAPPSSHARDRAYLIVLAGSNVGEMFKLDGEMIVIGRGRNADIRLLDDGISRAHARIRLDDKEVLVEDMDSRNGTFCNGKPIVRQPLADGDKIQVGRTTILKFTYHDDLDESFQQQMYDSALRDGLTRAFNKRYFQDRLVSEFKFAERHRAPLSVLMLDIDHFKKVNDLHGHLAGDAVLQALADKIHNVIRNEDVFARYGGEEFAIICRATPQSDAGVLAERIRSSAHDLPVSVGPDEIRFTVSVGVAGVPDVAAANALELISAADKALYAAKRAGRDRIVIGNPE